MEPITAGTIAFLTALGTKIVTKSEDKLADWVINQALKVREILGRKQPQLVEKVEGAGVDQAKVLVGEILEAARQDPELTEALQQLGLRSQGDGQIRQVIEKLGNQYINSTVTIEKQEFNF